MAHPTNLIGVAEVYFIPFCLRFVSTHRSEPRAKAERTQSEGTLYPKSIIIIPKKPKIRVPILKKNSGRKRQSITITITIGMRPQFTPSS